MVQTITNLQGQQIDVAQLLETVREISPSMHAKVMTARDEQPERRSTIAGAVQKYIVSMVGIRDYYHRRAAQLGERVLTAMDDAQADEILASSQHYQHQLNTMTTDHATQARGTARDQDASLGA